MLAALAALALATSPLASDDEEGPAAPEPARWQLSAVGGAAVPLSGGGGPTAALAGAELAYAFEFANIGLLAQGYRLQAEGASPWSPVLLLRFEERFETARGVEAVLAFGLGAGKTRDWQAWFQVALGGRLRQGALSVGAEIGFEQRDLLRLALVVALDL
jgi:hypothetical protein